MSSREDKPRIGLFNKWYDAYYEALFRADITGRRYKVRYERENQWWCITEQVKRHRPCGFQATT